MNLEYIITNEFGEKVVSYDPTIGIPTKAKYRFKIKWQQPATLSEQTRRAYYLVPNIREYGWISSNEDPNNEQLPISVNRRNQLASSYYFGLDWTGYTDGIVTTTEKNAKLDEIINCEDTFYEFNFNKVYTIAGLIDEYKNGGRGRFVGIKEIDNDDCSNTVNKFPVNDGFRNFDFLFFIFSLLFQLLQQIGVAILIIAHIVLFIYSLLINLICLLCTFPLLGSICSKLGVNCQKYDFTIRLPMITYPDCEACECNETTLIGSAAGNGTSGTLSYVSSSSNYFNNLQSILTSNGTKQEDVADKALIYSQAIAGNGDTVSDVGLFKMPKSKVQIFPSDSANYFAYSTDLPLGERINIFNTRDSYFSNELNKIKVTFAKDYNSGTYHFDNTITILSNTPFASGDLVTSVDPGTSSDLNFLYTKVTNNGVVQGITGVTQTGPFELSIEYADSQSSNSTSKYQIPKGG
jgi:hypothetical protein